MLTYPRACACCSSIFAIEMGNMVGAMQTCQSQGGCSVLGWNHPGFGASSGTPTPDSEAAAIDAMLEFAQDSLGYAIDDIFLHGWSIGGFATSWAAMNHQGIRGSSIFIRIRSLCDFTMSTGLGGSQPEMIECCYYRTFCRRSA